MEAFRRSRGHGDAEHQRFSRRSLRQAPGSGGAGASLSGSGGHPSPEPGHRGAAAPVAPRAQRAGQGDLAGSRCRRPRGGGARVMGLIEELGRGPVGLDSAIFIYLIEEDRTFLPLVETVFAAIDAGRLAGVTLALTLLEVLVVPYRHQNEALARRYEALLTRSRNLRLAGLDLPLLRAAAALRAAIGLKTPDALQLAAALAGT